MRERERERVREREREGDEVIYQYIGTNLVSDRTGLDPEVPKPPLGIERE